MNKKWKKIWLKALRSDAYVQGANSLVPTREDMECTDQHAYTSHDTFCCLGVLVNEMASEQGLDFTDISPYANTEFDKKIRDGVFKGWHIDEALGVPRDAVQHLMVMNDKQGKGFKAIATWIEKNL